MNPTKFKNDKAGRSLKAILAGADEECAKTNESVACGDEEKQEIENEVDDAPSEAEETEDEEPVEEEVESDADEPEEIVEEDEEPELDEEIDDEDEVVEDEPEEITEEEVQAARKEMEEEPEEIEEVEEIEEDDDEPISEEEVEEITEEEVQAARDEMKEQDDEPETIEDDDMSVEKVMDEDSKDDEELDEEEEVADEDSTTEAVAMLVKKGFSCSIDNRGKIVVSGCEKTEACDCGDENCPECKEEEASVTLRPVDAEEKVDAEAVQTVLTGAESESPFYTVLISGMPVATIALADQPNAEAIRAYFLSNKYPSKLATAMAVSGVKNVLDTQHAKMFTAAVSKTEVAQAMKAEAKADFDKQMSEAIIAMKDKFVSAVKLAVAGMNKNFFTEPNDLKGAAYAAFSSLGHDENIANEKTEAIIAEAGSFFDTAIAKATELMGKSDEAFAEISDMIAKAGVATRTVKTFASALEQGNNPVIASVMRKQDEEVKPTKTTAAAVLHGKKLFGRR